MTRKATVVHFDDKAKQWQSYDVSVVRSHIAEIWNDAFGLKYNQAFYVEIIETAAGAIWMRPRGSEEHFRKAIRVGAVSMAIVSTSTEKQNEQQETG